MGCCKSDNASSELLIWSSGSDLLQEYLYIYIYTDLLARTGQHNTVGDNMVCRRAVKIKYTELFLYTVMI